MQAATLVPREIQAPLVVGCALTFAVPTAYSKFNGAEHNYDGFGRDARANDTLYFYTWLRY